MQELSVKNLSRRSVNDPRIPRAIAYLEGMGAQDSAQALVPETMNAVRP